MPRSLKFSLFLSFVLVAMVLFFYLTGLFQSELFEQSISEVMPAPREEVWNYLVDVETRSKSKQEVTQVLILEKNDLGLPLVWREETDLGGYRQYRLLEWENGKRFVQTLESSSFRIHGSWTYTIEATGNYSKLIITESSRIESPLVRGATFFVGRANSLQKEMELARNHFAERSQSLR
ncbi:SRPBCC family protein [Leptospira ryugenii]|nr:SRPBCC family protein [Leptospira ryugenii]